MLFSKLLDKALLVVGVLAVGYHLLTTQYLFVGSYEHQAIHLVFIMSLIFLNAIRSSKSFSGRGFYTLMLFLGFISVGYVLINMTHLEMVIGFPELNDVLIGVLLIVLVVVATHRSWGMSLPIVASVFVVYFIWGHELPRPLYHREFNFDYIISYLSIGLSGIFGTFLSISANFVFIFVIFGALLEVIKVNELFTELGKAAGRVFRGGPGQTAVISSAMVGTVTGAAIANVAITGAFTIPYMKRSGYSAEEAGAIEATASTGGQIMPPIMGASAFLMAAFMGVPYSTVMMAALIPAILYFWGCIFSVQLIAVRNNLTVPPEAVDKKLIARRLPLFLIPIFVLVTMLSMNYSPSLAGFWAIVLTLVLSCLRKETRPSFSELMQCLARGALIGAQIGIALAIVGLMAQTLITTGLGTKVANIVDLLSGGHLWLALIITMLVSIILGMGIPTSAAYALVAIVVVPSLIDLGVTPIAAHFFAFYFAVVSSITPPVALAALTAAGISGGNYMKTSFIAFQIAISGFIIPFLVVYNPVMLMRPENWMYGIAALIAIALGMTAITMVIFNCALTKLNVYERLMAAISAVLMIGFVLLRHIPDLPLEFPMLFVGIVVFLSLMFIQVRRRRSESNFEEPLPKLKNS